MLFPFLLGHVLRIEESVVVVHGSRRRDLPLSSSAYTDPNAGRMEGLCVYFSDGLRCLFHSVERLNIQRNNDAKINNSSVGSVWWL